MKKLFIILLFLIALVPALFGQAQAVIREVAGKVEVRAAASATWVAAKAGLKLTKGSYISTGFNSTAVLELGNSVLQVKPLTRLQLEELVAREGTVATDLFLKVGKIRAEVKTGKGLAQSFKVKSPVSTAAVRGTEFEFDGLTVNVINGLVFFSNTLGQGRNVGGGESSSTGGTDTPTSADEEKQSGSAVDPYTSTSSGEAGTGLKAPGTATVTILWVPIQE